MCKSDFGVDDGICQLRLFRVPVIKSVLYVGSYCMNQNLQYSELKPFPILLRNTATIWKIKLTFRVLSSLPDAVEKQYRIKSSPTQYIHSPLGET